MFFLQFFSSIKINKILDNDLNFESVIYCTHRLSVNKTDRLHVKIHMISCLGKSFHASACNPNPPQELNEGAERG